MVTVSLHSNKTLTVTEVVTRSGTLGLDLDSRAIQSQVTQTPLGMKSIESSGSLVTPTEFLS